MAKRILVFTDDYNESWRLETVLRKLGFDVVVHLSETSLNKEIVGFRPDVVVASGHTQKVSAISVGAKLRGHRNFTGASILGLTDQQKANSKELVNLKVDRIIDSPLQPDLVIESICDLLKMDVQPLREKLKKLQGESAKKTNRSQKYAKFLDTLKQTETTKVTEAMKTTFVRGNMKDRWRQAMSQVKQPEGLDPKQLDEEKKKFVEALFKKGK